MAILKLDNGRYRVLIDAGYDAVTGARVRQSRNVKSMREARRVEREMIEELANSGGGAKTARMTIVSFAELVYLPAVTESLAESTVSGYRSAIQRHIIPALGELQLSEVTAADIRKMLAGIDTRGGQENARGTLRQMFTYAISEGLVSRNPARDIKFKRVSREPHRPRLLETPAEMVAYADAVAGSPVEPAVLLCLGAGLRKSEALGADWSDFDAKGETITVRRSYVYSKGEPDLKEPKTASSLRTVPVTSWAARRLVALSGEGNVYRLGAMCIHDGSRLHPERAADLLHELITGTETPDVRFANLRHSFATLAIASGVDVAVVSKWLGHTSITTTYNRYVRVGETHLQQGAEALNRVMEGVG